MEPVISKLNNGQIYLHYGPVSMTVLAQKDGKIRPDIAEKAYDKVYEILTELAEERTELSQNQQQVRENKLHETGQKMWQSCRLTRCNELTPMAAVAGTIADLVADSLMDLGMDKVIVNNGGDIAIRLGEHENTCLEIGAAQIEQFQKMQMEISVEDGIGGVATSGLGGRSLTKGIAEAVTVFAANASIADAFATYLANQTYIHSDHIHTARGVQLDPDTDIPNQIVVTGVDVLTKDEVAMAAGQLEEEAKKHLNVGTIRLVIAFIQGHKFIYS